MNVLAIDIGGTNVKILASGQKAPRKFPSGPNLTPRQMAAGVKRLARGWKFEAVSIGYPGMVIHNRPVAEPRNLGRGWIGFDYRAAFRKPVKIV
ncbi:MAG TPA: ROK family protein, partial [Methylomirabilota bacterium]